jgi:hypothetical protein
VFLRGVLKSQPIAKHKNVMGYLKNNDAKPQLLLFIGLPLRVYIKPLEISTTLIP